MAAPNIPDATSRGDPKYHAAASFRCAVTGLLRRSRTDHCFLLRSGRALSQYGFREFDTVFIKRCRRLTPALAKTVIRPGRQVLQYVDGTRLITGKSQGTMVHGVAVPGVGYQMLRACTRHVR